MSSLRSVLPVVLAALFLTAPSASAATATGPAPGAPGSAAQYLPADKSGVGTSATTASKTWLTVQKEGGLGELFYPDLSTPSARSLRFLVADTTDHSAAWAASPATSVADSRSLSYRQTFKDPAGRWQLTATYATDPARNTVLADVAFTQDKPGNRFTVYAIYEPTLADSRPGNAGATQGDALTATHGAAAGALVGSPAFTATSSGYRGTSDGPADLVPDGRMDWQYTSAAPGNLVQTAELDRRAPRTTIAIGFGGSTASALSAARESLGSGFASVSGAYADGWHSYLGRIKAPPASLGTSDQQAIYRVSAMTLAASEDKTNRGAYVASHTMPWVWGNEAPSGPYHLVWSRDLYQIATALIADGDTAGAGRALDFLFDKQQKADGSFPQNSTTTGAPFWGGLQLDEVAFPIVLAHQLGRSDAGTWSHVKRAADFLVGFQQDGNSAPWTPQDRWENQSGYSPATIASEIAGLVCAADIAKANGDNASANKYLKTADDWQSKVKGWTATTTGPYSSGPYFLRLTKDGNPNAGTAYDIGDSSYSNVDQRRVVDPSFLDLVRLGVLPPNDPAVVNSLKVIDDQLGVSTARGFFWHRASFDGYGEKRDGAQWEFGLPNDSRITLGRAWPLLNGERGEYQLAAGQSGAATQLKAMANAAGPGDMLPEQVWDDQPPSGQPGFTPGTPTFSATPLAWTHAQYIRLAFDAAAGKVLEQPAVVAARYAGG